MPHYPLPPYMHGPPTINIPTRSYIGYNRWICTDTSPSPGAQSLHWDSLLVVPSVGLDKRMRTHIPHHRMLQSAVTALQTLCLPTSVPRPQPRKPRPGHCSQSPVSPGMSYSRNHTTRSLS